MNIVFGHTRLASTEEEGMLLLNHLVMIDSQQCFIIDEDLEQKIMPINEYKQTRVV